MLLPFLIVIWPFSNHEDKATKLLFLQNKKVVLRIEVTVQVNNAF